MAAPIYVLGTGLSHDGSAVLLKDGVVCVGIEKERLTRRKHDGGNDAAAIAYCLAAAGITLADVAVVVQTANFEVPARGRFRGPRPLAAAAHPPLVSISHHLAHAWSVAGTAPFDEGAILVIDGCGSPRHQCTDLDGAAILASDQGGFACEKDSFYHFDGRDVVALVKDFSPILPGDPGALRLPTTQHSIGGFYAAVSHHVFGNLDDAGKLMGLAPYGRAGAVPGRALAMRDGRLLVEEGWQAALGPPAAGHDDFRASFARHADTARWAQHEVEEAVMATFRDRLARFPHARVCYAGGVALNAVANARLLDEGIVEDLHIGPAAGDNGLALGCAFHGWMKVLGRARVRHDGGTCFGRRYAAADVGRALAGAPREWTVADLPDDAMAAAAAGLFPAGRTVAWFQDGSEFGPRALGRRSILAHPGIAGMGDHINAAIKFREDFRPFAPAVLRDHAPALFAAGRDSPYMILVDRTRPAFRDRLRNVTHVDGTARVQTVERDAHPRFHRLLEAFHALTGLPCLLNTSFNRRGMPIVETPDEAVALFAGTALDALVLQGTLVTKPRGEAGG